MTIKRGLPAQSAPVVTHSATWSAANQELSRWGPLTNGLPRS
jgi:hypothetical protein